MITKEQLRHLAELAKIDFTDEELEKFLKDINQILEYVSEIQELNLEEFEPMIGGILQELLLREDKKEVLDEETKKLIIEQFPEKENNFLKVPKVIHKPKS